MSSSPPDAAIPPALPPDPHEQDLAAPAPGAEPPCEPPRAEEVKRERNRLKKVVRVLGPGLITGASNNDPSAIGTYAKAGAAFGFSLLWMAPLLFPMMACIVYISAKLGMVTGRGLAGNLRAFYPRWVLYPLIGGLVVANTIGAGADLGAIAEGVHLIIPSAPPKVILIPIGISIVCMQILLSYRRMERILRWLTLALLGFIVSGWMAHPPLAPVLYHTFVPEIQGSKDYIAMLVAILGTALSPYLYFWQASLRVEEDVSAGRHRLWQRRGASGDELRYAALDVNTGTAFACVIIYSIILATAATLFRSGIHDIDSAARAAEALAPAAGALAAGIFATAMVGAGLLATPVLTGGAAYAVCETFQWKFGMAQSLRSAPQFYTVIALCTVIAVALNFTGVNPMTALYYAGLINGLLIPPLVVIILLATNNRAIMGTGINRPLVRALGWGTAAITTLAVISFLITSIS
jgi:NRAMP (natural resistance-associated macrophage protein)-like metal ion transporter